MVTAISQQSAKNYQRNSTDIKNFADVRNNYSNTEIGNANNLDFSATLGVSFTNVSNTIYYNTYTDYGAVRAALQTAQRAMEAMQDLSRTVVAANVETMSLVLENHRTQLRELQRTMEKSFQQLKEVLNESQRQKLKSERVIWRMVSGLTRKALIRNSRQIVAEIDKSLVSMDKAQEKEKQQQRARVREEKIKNAGRVINIELAETELQKISSDLNDRTESQKKLRVFLAVIFPTFVGGYLSPNESLFVPIVTGLIACSCLLLVPEINRGIEERQSHQKLLTIYKLALEQLKKDPNLTIRAAVRQQSSDPTVLQKLPDVFVPEKPVIEQNSHSYSWCAKSSSTLPRELQDFVDVAKQSPSALRQST